ncbi:MAG: hypothetical protein M3R21_10820 [Candidatus Dormibacteraeota bacterium]|nr:hypothetical protein [Candidatus Dormibacteraeota bacterium]
METDVRWHHGQTLAAGQVAEFKVWAELVRQSLGGLHVFLPLRDLGIDGVVHRLDDGEYMPVQVKGRTELTAAGQVHITVTASSLNDGQALVVATLVDGEQLGRFVLVVEEATFRELAVHNVVKGREYLTAAFQLHAGGQSRWAPYLVARERLAERFGVVALAGAALPEEVLAVGVDRGHEGFVGEMEVVRRLADGDSLNLFRPFPDLETVEVLARHISSRRFLGLQVKTVGWDREHLENRIYVRRSSFRSSASTFICVLGWNRDLSRFEDDCLLIPSTELAGIARVEGDWMMLELEPGSVRHRRTDRYRNSLASLALTVESLLV